jgi:NADH dehydrogenase [ubiquinone] 1 alpha subcomplex assembly factor 7
MSSRAVPLEASRRTVRAGPPRELHDLAGEGFSPGGVWSAVASGLAVASALGGRLRERIRREGPLPFSAWMDACLYDPEGGFYTRTLHPAGTQPGAHFATAPTLHPFFAQAVAAELTAAWRRAGSPAAWTVAEFGAGTGALARDAVAALRRDGVPAEWVAVDVRPAGAEDADGVRWSEAAPAAFDAAVANEFLDAVPFDLHEWSGGGWRRVGVGLDDGGRFAWRLLGPSRAVLPPGRDGERRVVMAGVGLWLGALARAGAKVALVADYGRTGPSGDVRAFRGQAEADPLDEPGTADLTADVDFAALERAAAANGFKVASAETQEQFLLRHGALEALNAVDRGTVEGASSYLRFRQLLLPTGLGVAFKVLRLERQDP